MKENGYILLLASVLSDYGTCESDAMAVKPIVHRPTAELAHFTIGS